MPKLRPRRAHRPQRQSAGVIGSEHWYRHGINPNVLFTDGAKYLADHAGTYWLLDEIANIQLYDKRITAATIPVWAPDGEHIAYRTVSTGSTISWIRTDGGGEPQRLLEAQAR